MPFSDSKYPANMMLVLTERESTVLRSALATYANAVEGYASNALDENAAADWRLAAREAEALIGRLNAAEGR